MERGVLAGPAHPITEEQRFHVIAEPSNAFQYAVDFEEAEMWEIAISPVRNTEQGPIPQEAREPDEGVQRIDKEDKRGGL